MDIPENVTWILVATGALLILAALIGGGLELKEVKLPRLNLGARILCFCVGGGLIALVVVPNLMKFEKNVDPSPITKRRDDVVVDPTPPGPKPEPKPELMTTVPPLKELPLEEARGELERADLVVGQITYKSVWVVGDEVLDQTPSAGNPVPVGQTVNLVVARPEFLYRAERKVVTKDETTTAVSEYKVRPIRAHGRKGQFGEFELLRADVQPINNVTDDMLRQLVQTRGLFPATREDLANPDFKLVSTWDALERMVKTLGEMVDESSIQNGPLGVKGLSDAIMLAFIEPEVSFDLRAIFNRIPQADISTAPEVMLQPGSEFRSVIRLEGRGVPSDAGATRTYDVVRKAPKGDKFEKVGSATYSVDDGLLKKLYVRFNLMNSTNMSYRVEINQF